MSNNILPTLSIKGLVVTENTHEKYGTTKEIKCSGKTGKYPSISVNVDGVLHKLSIGSLKTETLDSEGQPVWVPVLRLQEVKASVPTKPVVNVSEQPKVTKAMKDEFAEFLAFKAMKAAAGK